MTGVQTCALPICMIGSVTYVGELTSTVSLLTRENAVSQLPVSIISDDKEYYGLLDSYDTERNAYRVILLSDSDGIVNGLNVVTSGLGGTGKSPRGILVGTTLEVSKSESSVSTVVYVQPTVDFNALTYLAVVQRVNE